MLKINDPKIKQFIYNIQQQSANKIKMLENELQVLNQKNKDLMMKLENEVQVLNQKNKNLMMKLENQSNNDNECLEEKNQLIKTLQNQVKSIKNELEMNVKQHKAEKDLSESKIEILENELSSATMSLKTTQAENEKLKNKNNTEWGEKIEIKNLKDELKLSKDLYEDKIKTLKMELTDKKKTLDKINKIIIKNNEYFETITSQLESKNKLLSELETTLDIERRESEVLKQEFEVLKEELVLAKKNYILSSQSFY